MLRKLTVERWKNFWIRKENSFINSSSISIKSKVLKLLRGVSFDYLQDHMLNEFKVDEYALYFLESTNLPDFCLSGVEHIKISNHLKVLSELLFHLKCKHCSLLHE